MDKPINCFPGYQKVIEWNAKGEKIVHNMYRGTDLGLGGYVYFEPGVYENVTLIDLTNAHGASIIALNKFGKYTQRFADIREANIAIKRKDFEKLKTLMDGKLVPYINDPNTDWKAIRNALKLVCNSSFGISAASFDNPLRDSRDDNDIIALRGALFMRTLQDEIEERGYHVIHIKTDSMKIPNASPEIVQFCMDFAKKYGYEFEHEAIYSKLCLVNGSTYVAKHQSVENCKKMFGYAPGENIEAEESGKLWTATAAQFKVPYVFKTLFSHEPIVFKDYCETKSVQTALYLDFNENLPDTTDIKEALTKWDKSLTKLSALSDEMKSPISRDKELIQKDIDKEQRSIDRQQSYLQNRLGVNIEGDELITLARKAIDDSHDYQFVGGVGLFTPVVAGAGGGELVRSTNTGNYASVAGAKGYRWMESEFVRATHKEEFVNEDYYRVLVDEAVKDISECCEDTNKKKGTSYTFDWFASDIPVPPVTREPVPGFMPEPVPPIDADEEIPFEERDAS